MAQDILSCFVQLDVYSLRKYNPNGGKINTLMNKLCVRGKA